MEDCAASLGTVSKGVPTGATGRFSILSGDAFKMLPVSAGMGVLLTKDPALVATVQSDSSFASVPFSAANSMQAGMKKVALSVINNPVMYGLFYTAKYRFSSKKTNDDTTIAQTVPQSWLVKTGEQRIGEFAGQMETLDKNLEKRRNISQYYFNELKGLKHVRVMEEFSSVNNDLGLIRFPIFIDKMKKMEFYNRCVRQGIDLGFVFSSPLPGSENTCPNALKLCKSVLNLPFYPGLTKKEMEKVVNAVRCADRD